MLIEINKQIILQWIPAHVGITGNENADQLAKKGATRKFKPPRKIEIDKQLINTKTNFQMQQKKLKEYLLKDKEYKNIMTKRDILSMPRKNAVALFRMEVGHDYLAEHLYKIHCLPSPKCTFCMEDEILNNHLEHCKGLMGNSLTSLYWEARGKMMQIN